MNWERRSGGGPSDSPLPMPQPIWKILSSRGYHTKESIEALLYPKLRDIAHPYSLDHMGQAVERLIRALQSEETVLLYGDYDLDGTPGLALLRHGLLGLGFKSIKLFQPSRLQDGYGLHARKMSEFKSEGVTLVVTVDLGITDLEAVYEANQLGLDVVITDHHLPKDELPPAYAIVNPNKGTCSSSLQHLCGAGVAFYLILALRMEMERLGLLKTEFNPKDLLDLLALATITDMVPLVAENRVLVKHGLHLLSQTKRPGLKRLFMELGYYNKKLTSQDVAFRIAPKLNALTRLEEGVRALDILLADESSAKKLVDEALVVNQRRIQFQEKAKRIATELVRASDKSPFLWIHSREFHPGVISLVASDLMNQFGVPVFVGAEHGEGRIVGSARAPSKIYNLQEALKSAQGVLTKFGGHQLAAGFEVSADKAGDLSSTLAGYFSENKHLNADSDRTVIYDTEVRIADLDETFMGWYEGLGPFGMHFEAPLLCLEKVGVRSVRKLKGSFLRYTLEQDGRTVEAPWFNRAVEFPQGSRVDVIFEPQWNEYNGRRTIQALIQGMRLRS